MFYVIYVQFVFICDKGKYFNPNLILQNIFVSEKYLL